MRETRIKLFLLMELEKCRKKLGGLIKCHNCIVDNSPEEDYLPKPLPIRPGYTKTLERRMRKAVKGVMPLTLKKILKTYYSLPGGHAPVYPKHPEIFSCSQSPMPYDQIKCVSSGAQADG